MDTKMNIVVISTDSLLTPPTAYGGIEKIAWLTVKGLSELGHRVHLIAKEGSALPPNGNLYIYSGDRDLIRVVDLVQEFKSPDCWIDETHNKILTTHRPNLPQLSRYQVMSLMGDPSCPVLISQGQRDSKFGGAPYPIIYQSIDLSELPLYTGQRDNYLLYMGQRIPEKRIDWAMDVAIQSGIPLKTFSPGWGDAAHHRLLESKRDAHPDLISIEGDIGGEEKISIIQHAKALLHLVGANNWCEAGGIIVLEALACGTPCIVTDNGCLPEYVVDGFNGFIVHSVEEAVNALQKIDTIDPRECRKSVEKFDYRIVAPEYESLCRRIARGERWR